MTKAIKSAVLAAILVAGAAGGAIAAPAPDAPSTPKSWNYEIKDGKRVPKANRVTNADGSWREEAKQGTCTTVKERTATGEYKETRRCD